MSEETQRREQGFTLMELMIVIVILGILMAIVAPKFMQGADEANRLEAKRKCDVCRDAIMRYKLKYNKLPNDLRSLTEPDDRKNYGEPWIEQRDIVDPWGNDLELRVESASRFEVLSFGSDGSPGGTELLEMDISSARPLDEEEDGN